MTFGKINKKVKKAMIDQELNITQMARITGYTRGHLSNVINGHFESPKARKAISEALGRNYAELWGREATLTL